MDHPVPRGPLQNQVLAFHLIALLFRHGMVAPHILLGLFGLESLVLTSGFHTSHAFLTVLTVMRPHFLHAVKGRIFVLPIALLADSILVGVSFLLRLHWRIHGQFQSTVPRTRPPTFSTFEMGPACSA